MATTRKKEAVRLPDWFANGRDNMRLHYTSALMLTRAGEYARRDLRQGKLAAL